MAKEEASRDEPMWATGNNESFELHGVFSVVELFKKRRPTFGEEIAYAVLDSENVSADWVELYGVHVG